MEGTAAYGLVEEVHGVVRAVVEDSGNSVMEDVVGRGRENA